MNAYLLNRESASLLPSELRRLHHETLVRALQPSTTSFERVKSTIVSQSRSESSQTPLYGDVPRIAHHGGVNSIVIDRFEGRYLLSGGADASIAIWDLDSGREEDKRILYKPIGAAAKSEDNHSHGITQLSFYPFDSLAFLSSSYDYTLKIWSSETLQPSASFNLESVIYGHDVSPVASHLLVACATQHPAVRLVDLRSGAASHSVPGHHGTLLSVAWSPVEEHVLASAGTDGTVRFWDIRRSAAHLSSLDLEDSVGLGGYDGHGSGARHATRGKAHTGPVNGVVWTQDGRHVVTTGNDEKIRVWDYKKGANTLASFGPLVKNKVLAQVRPCLAPPEISPTGRDIMLYPSEREILVYELFEGRMLKRLRPPGVSSTSVGSSGKIPQKQRVIDLAWRKFDVEFYSAHGDGTIKAWKPRTSDDAMVDEEERLENEAEGIERDKKRKALEDIYQDFAKKRLEFSR